MCTYIAQKKMMQFYSDALVHLSMSGVTIINQRKIHSHKTRYWIDMKATSLHQVTLENDGVINYQTKCHNHLHWKQFLFLKVNLIDVFLLCLSRIWFNVNTHCTTLEQYKKRSSVTYLPPAWSFYISCLNVTESLQRMHAWECI